MMYDFTVSEFIMVGIHVPLERLLTKNVIF